MNQFQSSQTRQPFNSTQQPPNLYEFDPKRTSTIPPSAATKTKLSRAFYFSISENTSK